MNVTFETKGDFDELTKWLDSVSKSNPTVALNQIAREGVRSLEANTPRDTGETAKSWTYDIESKNGVHEIAWKNTAHSNSQVSVAKLIDQGHGTKNGGYVPPRPYISKSMESVFKEAGNTIAKELTIK